MYISLGGMRLKVPDELETSRPYFLSFYLPTGESFKDVECRALKEDEISRSFGTAETGDRGMSPPILRK